MPLSWTLHDLRSGDLTEELPLTVNGTVEKTVGESSSLGVTLAVRSAGCPANWATLIDPMRAMFVLSDDDGPIVGYYLAGDGAGKPTATFALTSLEGLLNETYCRTHDFYEGQHDETVAAATLLADVVASDRPGGYNFEVDATPTGRTADHSYLFEEEQTVGDALADLSKTQGGPEWTVRLRWADSTKQRIIKTIEIGPRIGADVPGVVVENAHLAQDGYRSRIGSYSRGKRATYVIATGDGSGGERSMSTPSVDADAFDDGVIQWEVRLPTTGVTDDIQLERISDTGLARRRRGIRTWEMELAISAGAPRPGRDFDAGDRITIDSAPLRDDPIEWRGPARVIGWRAKVEGRDFSTVSPVFYEEPEENVA
ncbi:hypothetical protein [Aeromicrobium endophyticum]|uniref:Phage tail protein n=1 Tax=Aeromicrobium endophyticum TaxID=2292704 RepID=A0A371PDP8_9ACTN|nr:hypothetical protein [Aeromicrobium endophyticum]REK73638.1 hypothetical protein DX116_08920 [Aeromicrobium endophyticum]